eukprot:TRINITY_DN3412_c2_g4_i3.p1 TRINITY_DN3412_c2_g4~~TRINITY_DN3412_c2_g4_i3.p1  ORF type:complete len:1022 (+),score=184.48 TRINITY_DN3412_c2_g4_i3:2467-5532(+)
MPTPGSAFGGVGNGGDGGRNSGGSFSAFGQSSASVFAPSSSVFGSKPSFGGGVVGSTPSDSPSLTGGGTGFGFGGGGSQGSFGSNVEPSSTPQSSIIPASSNSNPSVFTNAESVGRPSISDRVSTFRAKRQRGRDEAAASADQGSKATRGAIGGLDVAGGGGGFSDRPMADNDRKDRFATAAQGQLRLDQLRQQKKATRERKGVQEAVDLSAAQEFRGTCQDMCPEKERLERELFQDLNYFEMVKGTEPGKLPVGQHPKVDHNRAVKKFARPSVALDATHDYQLPDDVRPPDVLKQTMTYLMSVILDSNEIEWYEAHNFVRDRTRAVRQDLTLQHISSLEGVEIVEICARFHILSEHRLCEEPQEKFDKFQNMEQLNKCLVSLRMFYKDIRTSQLVSCPNEGEFRAYAMLNHLEGDLLAECMDMEREVYLSKPVQLVLQVYKAYKGKNYVRFFKLVGQAPYLMACLLHKHFDRVRADALEMMNKVYSRNETYPLSTLVELLGFEDSEEAALFCEHYGLPLALGDTGPNKTTECVVLKSSTFVVPTSTLPVRRSERMVEAKSSEFSNHEIVETPAWEAVPVRSTPARIARPQSYPKAISIKTRSSFATSPSSSASSQSSSSPPASSLSVHRPMPTNIPPFSGARRKALGASSPAVPTAEFGSALNPSIPAFTPFNVTAGSGDGDSGGSSPFPQGSTPIPTFGGSSVSSGSEIPKPCRFYNPSTKGGCRRGAACYYRHDDGSVTSDDKDTGADSNDSNRSSSNSTGGGGGGGGSSSGGTSFVTNIFHGKREPSSKSIFATPSTGAPPTTSSSIFSPFESSSSAFAPTTASSGPSIFGQSSSLAFSLGAPSRIDEAEGSSSVFASSMQKPTPSSSSVAPPPSPGSVFSPRLSPGESTVAVDSDRTKQAIAFPSSSPFKSPTPLADVAAISDKGWTASPSTSRLPDSWIDDKAESGTVVAAPLPEPVLPRRSLPSIESRLPTIGFPFKSPLPSKPSCSTPAASDKTPPTASPSPGIAATDRKSVV